MTTLKLLSAALFASAVIAAPAMARDHDATPRHSTDDAYADPGSYAAAPDEAYAAYGYRDYGYRCVPAPRVGAFAGQPWGDNNVPCEPGTGAY
jgi:hypothetical protein